MTPIDKFGHKMTLTEFRSAVENGWFIDDDGSGYMATATEMDVDTNAFWDHDNDIFLKKHPQYTHVVWFNK